MYKCMCVHIPFGHVCMCVCAQNRYRIEKNLLAILIGWPGKFSMERVIESRLKEGKGASLEYFLGEDHP